MLLLRHTRHAEYREKARQDFQEDFSSLFNACYRFSFIFSKKCFFKSEHSLWFYLLILQRNISVNSIIMLQI